MIERYQTLTLSPIKTTGMYLVFGIVWITTTDWIVASLADTPVILATIKGWVFVGVSALLIFCLTYIRQQQIDNSLAKLRTATEQLQVLHRIFRHNIRNNITVIQGRIDIVQDGLDNPDHQANLETASQTAERITTLSQKLRVINETNLDPLTDEEIDLVTLTEIELNRLQKQYPEINVSTTMPESACISGDSALQFAIREILENAIQHNTNPLDQCELAIEITRTYGQIELRITDNGPGIPNEQVTPLQTGEETNLSHTNGIGLWLATWLSHRRGGEITFNTDSNQGTTVTFRFQVGTEIPLYQSDG